MISTNNYGDNAAIMDDHSSNVVYDWSAMPEEVLFDFFKRGITTDIYGRQMSDEQIRQSVKRIKARE